MENSLGNLILDANLIVDCDEILVNISPKWAKLIDDNEHVFGKYLDTSKIKPVKNDIKELTKLVLTRDKFYLTDWLKREDVDEIPQDIINKFMSLYDQDGFYYDLPLTKMAIGLNKLAYHYSVRKIYVVTRCASEKNYKSKQELIKSLFPSSKLEIIKIGKDEKKSSCLKNINIENGFVFEDEISNIVDYLDNGLTKCNIYVPMLGYNKPTAELLDKVELSNVCLLYY